MIIKTSVRKIEVCSNF